MKRRIKQARVNAGLSQQQLADALDKSRGLVGLWESLKRPEVPHVSDLAHIAKICKVSVGWLVGGGHDDSSQALERVPLIKWQDIATIDKLSTDTSCVLEWMRCPIDHSLSTYCLRVEGPSMVSGNALDISYPDKSLIFCDPEQINTVMSGSPVIAMIEGVDLPVFKVYYRDSGTEWLASKNQSFPNINANFTIVARVIGVFAS